MFSIRRLSGTHKTRVVNRISTISAYLGFIVFINGILIGSGFGNQNVAIGSIPKVSFTKREYRILSEEEYLELQDNEIDIAVGSLIIAKKIYPDLNIQKYLNQIDAMAKELEHKLKVCKSPSEIVKTINRYLFVKQKLKLNEKKYFLNNVLDEKCGQCASFSCLYLSITEKLQLPFYGVASPTHVFIRYDDGTVKINIETTAGGKVRTEEQQILEYLGVSSPLETAQDSIYLKNLTKRQFLSICLNNRGKFYIDKGDLNKAIVDYSKAIDLNPKYTLAYYNRGNAFYRKGDYDKAIQEYTKTIYVDSKYEDAYYNRGVVYYNKGDIGKAIVDYNKTIDLNPKHSYAYCNRGLALAIKGDFDKALSDLSQAITINSEDADSYFYRALVYSYKEDKKNTLQDLKKAIELDYRYKGKVKDLFGKSKEYAEDEEFKKIIK